MSLTVSGLERSLQFYGDTLGFRLCSRAGDTAELGTEALPLLYLLEQPGARRKPPHSTGLYHYAILLPTRGDLARALQRLAAVRYPIDGASDHLVSEALYLADPDGHGIEIYADRPRSTWPKLNGQLRMDTLPLDIDDLITGVKNDARPWNGLPPGTRIGHVHLHVADLRAAETFYREVIGFDLMVRYGNSASFLSAGGYHHHIGLNTWAGVGAPPPPPDAVRLQYFTVLLPTAEDLGAVVERAKAAHQPVEDTRGGVLLRDPSQNAVLLATADRPAPLPMGL